MAPFWADTDISITGQILYEVHITSSPSESAAMVSQVSQYISTQTGVTFDGTWMLVANWDHVAEFRGNSNIVSLIAITIIYIMSDLSCI